VPAAAVTEVERMLDFSLNCPLTSSAGRLFDAAAAMLDLCPIAEYEAQAAIRLEAVADGSVQEPYPYLVRDEVDPWILDLGPAFHCLLEDKAQGVMVETIAARFHRTMAAAVTEACVALGSARGLQEAALSGGVFQNRLLLSDVAGRLQGAGLTVYANSLVPANDGGVSLGQAAVALARLAGGTV
jgi:hydrogenase maturation protein HypF